MKYNAVIEWAGEDFNGYILDLPGCVAAGESPEEVIANLRESARLYLTELRRSGQPAPKPASEIREIEVEVA